MTAVEAMLNKDALSPQFVKYNPCYYCKRTQTCQIDCLPKIGFMNILENRLTNFHKATDMQAIEEMLQNVEKYNLPVQSKGDK